MGYRQIIREIGFGLLCLAFTLWFFHPAFYHRSATTAFPFPGELQTGAFYPISVGYVWLTGLPSAKLDFLIMLHFPRNRPFLRLV